MRKKKQELQKRTPTTQYESTNLKSLKMRTSLNSLRAKWSYAFAVDCYHHIAKRREKLITPSSLPNWLVNVVHP